MDIEPCGFCISVGNFALAHHRSQRNAVAGQHTVRRYGRIDPVRHQSAQVNERITPGRHVPIEHGHEETARIDQLTDDIAGATSTPHKKRMEKEKSTVTKQLAEVQSFDEKLRHYADQRIALDLDDGVKVNYGKFGDLLAEVKAITGKKPQEAVTA